ncbi:alkaline phosphatase PhoX [Candidatus Phycosocius spiralis]|uniref:dTDP-glucose 4,6-dehydratase n=1 Tax=Candidatus Phycosocius spiralis TaxID=2815099 RepID=A0ABQ4PWU2_9PROT|nr:alkaline phosphatase PhoX [Candidatus Phycosocius spiralis]GIU67544.1 dTDP-glucose 4,6-dehydratase [Candidatus Phycosocius spiralis]
MSLSRRGMLAHSLTLAGSLAFAGYARAEEIQRGSYVNEVQGYGPLVADKAKIVDLPQGFSYQVISEAGQTMDDGLVVPHIHDGMGCFAKDDERVILVRNHEIAPDQRHFGALGLNGRLIDRLDRTKVFDFEDSGLPILGGTTHVVYNLKSRKTEAQFLSLIGTTTNCAGGQTPWGSWLSCEESVLKKGQGVGKDHGYVFEVPASHKGLVDPVPIAGMGRFKHEAACIDPRTGIVYLTEDVENGLFYRFLPNDHRNLLKGGRLQAMGLKAFPKGADTGNKSEMIWQRGQMLETVWIDLDGIDSPDDDLRFRGFKRGAASVSRGEGIHFGVGELYLCATSGGPIGCGQILRYVPSAHEGQVGETDQPGRLQLFLESINDKVFDYGDNITVAPWGHLFVCEDRYSDTLRNHLRIVTPQGKVATFARNVFKDNAEWAGATFSPDGTTLFVNVQWPGFTLAITGPWQSFKT